MYEWDDNYGDASAYGGYDQQQQDYLQNALDAADLQTTLDSSGPGGGQTDYGLDPYAVGGQYDIANASTKKVLNDDNTTTYTMPDGSKFKFDPTSKTYTPEGSSTPFDASILNKIGTGLYDTFKKAFTKKNDAGADVTDWGKVLAAAGTAASVAGKYDQPKTPVGYQGGIPSLVASRAEVANTYDPNRRAGSSGQRYFSNSVYSAPDKATGVQAALEQQATALEKANKANPAGDFAQKIVRTTPDTYTGMRSMSPSGTLGQALTPEQIAAQTKKTATGMASGGIASARYLRGETDGMEDKIPARIGKSQPAALSHGEFVVPADVVSHLGNGNSDAGAKKLYQMMDRIRVARTGNKKQGKQINPDKFMPGGSVRHKPVGLAAIDNVSHFTAGGGVSVTSPGAAGTESNLSNWAGPAVTKMVGEAEAITAQPYKAYSGPLTAGASSVQNQAFQNAANLTVPTGSMGGFQPSTFGAQEAQNYMNPYLMSALNPQLEEARRQSQITQLGNQAKATQQGAFGGGRSAIMEAETQRNLGTNLANITGTGYKDAYDKAMQQFNSEQGRGLEAQTATNNYGLAALAKQQEVGTTQRDIEQQGITADMKQFEEEKDDPYKQLMRKQAIFQGLPITAQAAIPQTQTGAQQAGASIADVTALLKQLKLID